MQERPRNRRAGQTYYTSVQKRVGSHWLLFALCWSSREKIIAERCKYSKMVLMFPIEGRIAISTLTCRSGAEKWFTRVPRISTVHGCHRSINMTSGILYHGTLMS